MKTATLLLFMALTFIVGANSQTCYADRDCPENYSCEGADPGTLPYPTPGFCRRISGGQCPGDCGCPGNNQCSCTGTWPGCVQLDGTIYQPWLKPIPKGTGGISLISRVMQSTRDQLAILDRYMIAFYLRRP